jgi:hypothetical protein
MWITFTRQGKPFARINILFTRLKERKPTKPEAVSR